MLRQILVQHSHYSQTNLNFQSLFHMRSCHHFVQHQLVETSFSSGKPIKTSFNIPTIKKCNKNVATEIDLERLEMLNMLHLLTWYPWIWSASLLPLVSNEGSSHVTNKKVGPDLWYTTCTFLGAFFISEQVQLQVGSIPACPQSQIFNEKYWEDPRFFYNMQIQSDPRK